MIVAATTISATVTAIVWAADGVRFIAAGDSVDHVAAALATYVGERCDHVLWPRAARRVRALLDSRHSEAAVAAYFAQVGSRWDVERLEVHDMSEPSDWPSRG